YAEGEWKFHGCGSRSVFISAIAPSSRLYYLSCCLSFWWFVPALVTSVGATAKPKSAYLINNTIEIADNCLFVRNISRRPPRHNVQDNAMDQRHRDGNVDLRHLQQMLGNKKPRA